MARTPVKIPTDGVQVRHFPGTGGPMMLLPPNRRTVPVYQIPQSSLAFFAPARYFSPSPRPTPSPGPSPGPTPPGPGPGPGPGPEPEGPQVEAQFVSEHRDCEICGHPEYGVVSVPPKKYRSRTIQGILSVTRFYEDTDIYCTSACEDAGNISWVGTISDSPFIYSALVTCELVSISGDNANYTVTFVGATAVPPNPDAGASRGKIVGGPATGYYSMGNVVSFSLPLGTVFYTAVEWNYINWHGGPIVCAVAGNTAAIIDDWDYSEIYDVNTCEMVTANNSTRQNGPAGTPGALACTNPPLCYLPHISPVVGPDEPVYVENISGDNIVLTNGLVCVLGIQFGPHRMLSEGAVIDTLTVEDTEDDAIMRATPVPGTSNMAFYQPRTFYTFEYQIVAVDLIATDLTPGSDYEISLPVLTEDYGGGSPVDSITTYAFTATGTSQAVSDIFIPARGTQLTLGTPTVAAV